MKLSFFTLFFFFLPSIIYSIPFPTTSPIPHPIYVSAQLTKVIGSSSFTYYDVPAASDTFTTSYLLDYPLEVCPVSTGVLTSEDSNWRVLFFEDPIPAVNASAVGVFGQPDFTSVNGDNKGIFASQVTSMVVDSLNNLYIGCETGQLYKFKGYNSIGAQPVTGVIGQYEEGTYSTYWSLSSALEMVIDKTTGNIYVADGVNNRVIVFPPDPDNTTGYIDVFGSDTLGKTGQDCLVQYSSNTCFGGQPYGIALDCHGGVWVASEATTGDSGIFYFPGGSKNASVVYVPAETDSNSFGDSRINFDTTCQYLTVTTDGGSLYILTVSFATNPPTILQTVSFGAMVDGSNNTDSFEYIQSGKWDPYNVPYLYAVDSYQVIQYFNPFAGNWTPPAVPSSLPSASPVGDGDGDGDGESDDHKKGSGGKLSFWLELIW